MRHRDTKSVKQMLLENGTDKLTGCRVAKDFQIFFFFMKAVSVKCNNMRCACTIWEGHWAVDAPQHSCWGLAAIWGGDPIPTA